MLVTRQLRAWTLLVGLGIFMPFRLAQSKAKEVTEDATSELRMEEARETLDEHGAPSVNPNFCDLSFHIPWSGSACAPTAPTSPLASQEDLDHLKTLLEEAGSILMNLQAAAAVEASQSRYQDIVSELLPGIRETNSEFHEILQKFLRELEDHIQEDDHPHVADEKKKLQEHLRMMDHLLQVTGRLAEQLDQVSENLLVTLTKPLEEITSVLHRSVLKSS
ncbi:uncharacterized protein LOC132587610 [Heteronotia binoei]|uniref:uncharacterized protein LOC132587610 n=1 Tax=Heteronotia binoei TaxID=13085 RepID=UPI00292D6B35|nr:uncharacterized protein LOC132587610 [Heteronotia binoei]